MQGKFERLITKTNPDQRLSVILASKLLFLTDFDQKLDEYSSTMALPRQHWITQKNNVFRMKDNKLILKVTKFHVPNAYHFSTLG